MDCLSHTTTDARPSLATPAKTPAVCAKADDLTLPELVAYYDAMKAAADGLVGVFAQPRCESDAMQRILASRVEALDRECGDIAKLILAYEPKDKNERDDRAYFLIAYECYCGAGLPEIAALASSLAVTSRN